MIQIRSLQAGIIASSLLNEHERPDFSEGDRITIVRPQQLGGSYSIWP